MKTTSITTKREEAASDESEYETLALSIDSSGVEHLMGTLTNLYSNPLESVFREYVSNALDSHIKSKNKAPIRVDILKRAYPSILRIQDFGTGMSKDDVVNVYSKYASSTKRDSNEQIGAFGLGAKSALAIADRFDVVSIKDGVELVFFIKKNTRGVGVVHFVSEKPTTDANGVTVSIPLISSHVTALEALTAENKFFSTWNPELVILNGKSIASDSNVYNTDKFVTLYSGESVLGWLTVANEDPKARQNYAENISLTICGIRYKLDDSNTQNQMRGNRFTDLMNESVENFFDGLKAWGFSLTLNLPIGSVDLTPSREDVMVTEKTRRTLRVALEQAAEEIPRAFFSRLNKSKLDKAFNFYANHLPVFGIPNGSNGSYEYWPKFDSLKAPAVKYKGSGIASFVVFPKVLELEAKNASTWEEKWRTTTEINYFAVKHGHTRSTSHGYGKNSQAFYKGTQYRNYHNAIVVYGEDTEENRNTIKRNARSFCQATHESAYPIVYFVPTATAPTDKWLLQITTPVSIETLERVGKAYRSAKAKEAALNRTKTEKRPAAIHYGMTYNKDTAVYDIRKFGADEIKTFKQVVILRADEMAINSYELYHNPARGINQTFWANLQEMYDSEDGKGYDSDYNVLRRLAKTFAGDLVIALPRSRAIGPVEKANNNTVLLHTAIENRIKAISKNKAKLEVLKAISDVVTEKTNTQGARGIIDLIVENGLSTQVSNPLTRKVFEQIGNSEDYAELILMGRCFVSLTPKSIAASPEKYTIIEPFLRVNGVNKTNGWGEGYKYINAGVMEKDTTRRASVFVKLVNAIDSINL